MEEEVVDVEGKSGAFFIGIAFIVVLIALSLIIYEISMLFKEGKQLGSTFILGITLLYESLLIYQGIVPRLKT